MRILYGVVGEGMGHATRSRVLLEELTREHEVHIVASGRAKGYLEQRFSQVARVRGIWGLTIAYEGNSASWWQTVVQNVQGALKGLPQNVREYFDLVEEFQPDVVVSDFESFSYLFGRAHGLPVISVDNMQVINRCRHAPELLAGHEDQFQAIKAIVKSKLPGCFHYLVTTFFHPPVRKERTTLVPCILRPEVLAARPEPGEHLLVYQTATTNSSLPQLLEQSGLPCRVYGLRRDLREDVQEGNLTYRPFSEERFIEDLRTARAVVMGGSFTLMSEAVYLRKPVLSMPLEGQFEQVLNALYLEQLGYGLYAREMTLERLREFLARLPRCEEALQGYSQEGNTLTLEALRQQLERAAEQKGRWLYEEED